MHWRLSKNNAVLLFTLIYSFFIAYFATCYSTTSSDLQHVHNFDDH